jgi:haloalkane dehalogenase
MAHYRAARCLRRDRRHASAVLPGAIISSRRFLADVENHLTVLDQLPTLIVWADADIAFGDKERERWVAKLPNHTTVVLHGVGHFMQSDAAEELSEAIGTGGWAELARDPIAPDGGTR